MAHVIPLSIWQLCRLADSKSVKKCDRLLFPSFLSFADYTFDLNALFVICELLCCLLPGMVAMHSIKAITAKPCLGKNMGRHDGNLTLTLMGHYRSQTARKFSERNRKSLRDGLRWLYFHQPLWQLGCIGFVSFFLSCNSFCMQQPLKRRSQRNRVLFQWVIELFLFPDFSANECSSYFSAALLAQAVQWMCQMKCVTQASWPWENSTAFTEWLLWLCVFASLYGLSVL